MELLILVILIGLIPAKIAQSKGKSFVEWWIYGAALFIIALPHALIMKPDQKSIEKKKLLEGMKKCSYCAELIKAEATVCRYCGRQVSAEPVVVPYGKETTGIQMKPEPWKPLARGEPSPRTIKIILSVIAIAGVTLMWADPTILMSDRQIQDREAAERKAMIEAKYAAMHPDPDSASSKCHASSSEMKESIDRIMISARVTGKSWLTRSVAREGIESLCSDK